MSDRDLFAEFDAEQREKRRKERAVFVTDPVSTVMAIATMLSRTLVSSRKRPQRVVDEAPSVPQVPQIETRQQRRYKARKEAKAVEKAAKITKKQR